MCVGVTIASYGEIEFDAPGLVLQLISITAEAARLVSTQNLLQVHLKGSSPLVSLSLFAPCCFFFLLPIALYSEPLAIAALGDVWMVVLGNTLTAFTLNVAVVMLVSATSGLTLTLAGIIKDILLIAASVVLLGSSITYTQVRHPAWEYWGPFLHAADDNFQFTHRPLTSTAPHTHAADRGLHAGAVWAEHVPRVPRLAQGRLHGAPELQGHCRPRSHG